MAAAQNEADRLKNQNDARMAAAQTEADRLKRDSDAQMAAAQNEADRLKRENDTQRASAQADLDRAAREKSELRVPVAGAIQRHSADPRHTAWPDCEHVGCPFRHSQILVAASGARETGQGSRHRLRASGSEARREGYTDSVAAATSTISGFPNNGGTSVRDYLISAGNGGEFGHDERVRQRRAGGFQRHRPGPAAKSAGGISDLRRDNRHGSRHADRCQVTRCRDAGPARCWRASAGRSFGPQPRPLP